MKVIRIGRSPDNDIESEINLALSCISFADDGIRYEIVFGSTEQETEYYIF